MGLRHSDFGDANSCRGLAFTGGASDEDIAAVLGEPLFVPDEGTNSILISGTDSNFNSQIPSIMTICSSVSGATDLTEEDERVLRILF